MMASDDIITTEPQTDSTGLAAIFDRSLALAGKRLDAMSGAEDDAEFDRGARSAGSLVRTALQVNALQRQLQKDAAAHEQDPAISIDTITLSEDDLDLLRADLSAKLDRLEGGEGGDVAHADLARGDETDGEGGGAL